MTYENLMGWIEDNYPQDDYEEYNDWLHDVKEDFIFEGHVLPTEAERLMQEAWTGKPIEPEQEDVQEVESRKRKQRVYDNREVSDTPRFVNTTSADAIVIPDEKSEAEFRQEIRQQERLSQMNVERAREIEKRSIVQRIKDFFRRK